MADLSGQYLGRYYLSERLGEGGMAVVYKALDTRLERDVAIKIIRSGAFPTDAIGEILIRFEREAKSLARLSHPNIVKVHDYGEHEGSPYLVMEYLPGGTLKKLLVKPVFWQDAVRLLLPIARSVAYAHDQGILHRDIKPANILITESGEPMLSDFGVAKLFESDQATALTGSGMAIGTPEYMAPEQWTGTTSPLSDLYSLGIVLYEMVTGRKPYMADTPAAVLIKQATEPLPSPRKFVNDLPEPLDLVLIKTLAKEPEERYKDLNAFIHALENLRADVPVPEQKQIEEPEVTPEQETAAPVIIQTAPHEVDEIVHAAGVEDETVQAEPELDSVKQTEPGKIERKPSQKDGIAARLSKFFATSAKRRNNILVTSIVVLFVCVAGIIFVNRISSPPLFFSGVSGGAVQIYSLKRGTVTEITQTAGGIRNWSPVMDLGGNIYFTSNRAGKAEIFRFNTNTGELRQITDTPGRFESWSPTVLGGENIYFTSNRTGKAEIFGFNTNTGELWQITDTSGQFESWSPTIGGSGKIYFTSNRTGKAEIFGFDSNTGELRQITDTPGRAESWAPTIGLGAKIYFTSNRTGKVEIFEFNTNTGELQQETDTPGGAESWGPIIRGRNIYFTSNRSGRRQIYLLGSNETAVTDFESWTKEFSNPSPGN